MSQRPESFYYHIVSPFIFRLIASAAPTICSAYPLKKLHLTLPSESYPPPLHPSAFPDKANYLLFGNCWWRLNRPVGGGSGADGEAAATNERCWGGIKSKFGRLIRGGK